HTPTKAGRAGKSRAALTEWRVLQRFRSATLVEVSLHTGRTHQIRVHFSAVKHPLVGDTLYGAPSQVRIGRTVMALTDRNFLHAARIGFSQPQTGQWIELRAPLPTDLQDFLHQLATTEGTRPTSIDAVLAPYL